MSASKGIQGAQQGLGMASQAASMAGPFGAIAGGALDFVGQLLSIPGPRQRRAREAKKREDAKNAQLAKFQAQSGQSTGEANPQTALGGATLPLPSPPVAQAAPMQLPAPPQAQLQRPQLGGQQQQGPLGGQRNNYMMKMLMQGNR